MNEEKIFGEIKGIFGQIQVRNEQARLQKFNSLEFDPDEQAFKQEPRQQLREFFEFLKMDESVVSENEIDALIELAIYKKQEMNKKDQNLNKESKKKEELKDEPLTYEDLQRVFLVDEKQAEKEQKELANAFRILTSDFNEEMIELHDLERKLEMYNKDHKDSIPDIMNELKSQEDFIKKIQNKNYDPNQPEVINTQSLPGQIKISKYNHPEFEQFNYKQYLSKQYKHNKTSN